MRTARNILMVAALVAAAFLIGRHCGKLAQISAVNEKTDTLYIYRVDTAYLRPQCVRVYVRDTMRVPVCIRDTITVYAELPREVKVYESDTARVVVSGYQPELDSLLLRIPYRETIVTRTETMPAPRWSLGLQGGAGVVFPAGGAPSLGGYIGVGVSRRF